MKQALKNIIKLSSLLVFSLPGFAANIDCPPLLLVAKTKFIKTFPINERNHTWALSSDNFDYKGKTWNILFAAILPNANSEDEVLYQGQKYFDNKIKLSGPVAAQGAITVCKYSETIDPYLIEAHSPPETIPA